MSYSGFELYERGIKRQIDAITLTRSCQIGFTSAMFERWRLDRYEAAFLYWNSSTHEIGIELLLVHDDKRAFKLAKGKNTGGYLSAKNFLKANQIDPQEWAARYQYKVRALRTLGIRRPGFMFIFGLNRANQIEVGGGP
jgi:hypothetical protein